MPAKRTSLLTLAASVLLFACADPSASRAPQNPEIVEIPSEITCPSCRIKLEKVVEFGGATEEDLEQDPSKTTRFMWSVPERKSSSHSTRFPILARN